MRTNCNNYIQTDFSSGNSMLRVNAGYVNIYYLVGKHGGKMNIEQGKCSFEPICW